MAGIKRLPIFADSSYQVSAVKETHLLAMHAKGEELMIRLFAVTGQLALVKVPLQDGIYQDLITGTDVEVSRGMVASNGEPLILTNLTIEP